jgi:PAS domain S-box-containing protein
MRYYRQIGIFILLLVACFLVTLFIYNDVESTTIDQVNTEQMIHARQAGEGIVRFFSMYNSTLTFLAGNNHIIAMDPEGRQLFRAFFLAHSDEISSITRVDGNGTIRYTFPFESSTGANISGQAHVRKSMATHAVVTSDVFTSVQGFRAIAFVMPVFRNGTYDGSVSILIPFDRITAKYLEPVRILDNGNAWIVSQNGVILYSPFPGQIDRPADEVFQDSPTVITFVGEAIKGPGGISSYTVTAVPPSAASLTFEAVYLPVLVGDEHWSIIVATPRSEILGTLRTFRTELLVILAILVAILLYFTYYITRAHGIVREEEQRRIAEEALRRSERDYRNILKNMQDVFYRSDRDGNLIMVSPSGVDLLGYASEQDMLGKPINSFYARPEERTSLVRMIRENGSVTNYEIHLRKADGTVLTALTNTRQYTDEEGNYLGVEGILRDITDRMMAENALRQATKKLNLLTVITLNDIRNGLFTLSGYLELERIQSSEEKRQEYHGRETALLHQITHWLNIAKNYQDLGLNPPRWHNVKTTFILALSHLNLSGVTHSIDVRNLEIYADPLLETVFFNMAENISLHAPSASRLTLRYEIRDVGLVLILEDNGTGIKDERKQAIFERGLTPKNGMGLFMVREILEITGITIRECGTYGNGARFEMTVPRERYRFRDETPLKDRPGNKPG